MLKNIELQLDKFFQEWEIAQVKEVEEYENKRCKNKSESYLKKYEKNKKLIKLDTRRSFTRDGIVDEKEWNKGEKLLFILKEANIEAKLGDKELNGSVRADDDLEGKFWFKYQIINGKINRRRAIFRRLEKIGKIYSGKMDFSLKSVAYMNINKRGGLSCAKEDIIEGYFNQYKTQIMKEIEIINPSMVAICCGNKGYAFELAKLIKQELGIETKLYNHPSTRKMTDEEYLRGI